MSDEERPVVNVLDHGHVRLVDHMGDDLSVVRNARVSYDAEWRTGEDTGKDEKLIHYLLKNKHTSPFEAVQFTFDIKCPIFVARQWHRHRTWCMAGSTPLIFNKPFNGTQYAMVLSDVVRKWNPPAAKKQRSARSLQEFNRQRLGSMALRSPAGDVALQDAWFSGVKKVYTLKTRYGEITASADHVLKTPNGSARIGDSPKQVIAMIRAGVKKSANAEPQFTANELLHERWVEFADGYEVSDLGRVRSYWGQGARHKHATPFLKKACVNTTGRVVVSAGGSTLQEVSSECVPRQ